MRSIFTIIVSLFVASAALAQNENAEELPARLNLNDFPGVFIDEVIVPNPAEIFTLMEKLGQPDWAAKVRKDLDFNISTDRTDLALLFGTLIADGFIAVQAKDK
ncbi:MAG: hypothetical protein AAF585_20330, partial [Verrucomicrobiota bacterium]